MGYYVDAFGQRIRKTTRQQGFSGPGKIGIVVDAWFHYDRNGLLTSESDESGQVEKEYVWLEGMPIAVLEPGRRHAVHSDHLTTPRALINEQGIKTWENSPISEPFGTDGVNEDPGNTGIAVLVPPMPGRAGFNLRFPGQYFDHETGTHYNYFRDNYIPSLGRFGQSDPIGLLGGINTYLYAEGNPLMFVDPWGLWALSFDAYPKGVGGTAAINVSGSSAWL